MSWTSALSSGAQGAAAGSAFGPWGTAIGGGLGVLSSLFGGDDEEAGPRAGAEQWNKVQLDPALKAQRDALLQQMQQLPEFQKFTESMEGLQPEQLAARGALSQYNFGAGQGALDYADPTKTHEIAGQFYQDPSAAIGASRAQWEEMVKNPMVRGIGDAAAGVGGWGGTQMGTAIGRGVGQAATTQQAQEKQMELGAIQQSIQNAMGAQGAARQQSAQQTYQPLQAAGQLAGIGAGMQQSANIPTAFDFQAWQANQQGPLNQIAAKTNIMGAMPWENQTTGGNFQYGAPSVTQNQNPMAGAVQGGLGGMTGALGTLANNIGKSNLPSWLQWGS